MGGFAGPCFSMGQAYQRSGFSVVRFVRIQVFQISDFLMLIDGIS